jgi:malate synthase
MASVDVKGLEIHAPVKDRMEEVLTPEALEFVAGLHREFESTRQELLQKRAERMAELQAGGTLDFLESTRNIREDDSWVVAAAPTDLMDRRVEITGPTQRKMVINALNSGARGFMADFEDSNSPTWQNMIEGHVNLTDAIEGTIKFEQEDGKKYRLNEEVATLLVRPRGWHLPERHLTVDGQPIAGAFCDFGFYFFHNAQRLLDKGSGPYFYLPKMESHLEARLWNDVFNHAQDELDIPRGTVRATVLIETVPAAFEMDEILYELRDHGASLNAGRWDYMFSMIKCFRDRPEFVLPDRNSVTMTVPFMRAYTELLVKTCHRRGAHAMGGMAAFIPSRTDEEANDKAQAKLRDDKKREAGDGFDGTWVAHPDSVKNATAEFDAVLGDKPNQVDRKRDEVNVTAAELLDVRSTPGDITEEGLHNDVNVGIQYISSWLRGNGAAGIYGLMEDAATAEIARSQVWQWVRNGKFTREDVERAATEELERIRGEIGDDEWFEKQGRPKESRMLFEQVALADDFPEFLTLPAYEYLLENIEKAGRFS